MSELLYKEIYPVDKDDFVRAGEASAKIKRTLKQLGVDADKIRRTSVVSYECEINLIIHSLGGQMCLEVTDEEIIVSSSDKGPGIKDISLAMKEGWSTASDSVREMGFGAGMGLPNMKRHCDEFILNSAPGAGTEIVMKIKI
ncbi:MAG: anti-sigma regulatory factor [Clostridia bacterium]|nr:anti-sigma regulatory factor [Clostridia bacterium]